MLIYGKTTLLILALSFLCVFAFVPFVFANEGSPNTAQAIEPFPNNTSIQTPTTFKELVSLIVTYINNIVPLLVALALIGFLIGVTRYGFSPDNEESKKSARLIMVWGVIILFVMVSVFAILNVLTRTFFGT